MFIRAYPLSFLKWILTGAAKALDAPATPTRRLCALMQLVRCRDGSHGRDLHSPHPPSHAVALGIPIAERGEQMLRRILRFHAFVIDIRPVSVMRFVDQLKVFMLQRR